MNRTAIYPGSFDPFTNGHLDIVKKAAALFDEVYIVIGINAKKQRAFDIEKMKSAIEETLIRLNLKMFGWLFLRPYCRICKN